MGSKIVKSGYFIFPQASNRKHLNEIITDACLSINEQKSNYVRYLTDFHLFASGGRAYLRGGFTYFTSDFIEVRISTIEEIVKENNQRKLDGKYAIPFSKNVDNSKSIRVDFIIDDKDTDLMNVNLHIDALWNAKNLFPSSMYKDMYLKYWVEL